MYHKIDLTGEFEPDDLQQIPDDIRADRKDFGWVGLRFEIDDDDRVVNDMEDRIVSDSVFAR